MAHQFLGIDLGTQGLKALIVDERFEPLARGFAAYPTRHPHPGWAEQDPADWERALALAVAEAVGQARAPEIEAIGVTGQLDGCLAVDGGGRPQSPCLIWMDRRAELTVDAELRRRLLRDGGINADPSHMAAKIGWLRHWLGPQRGRSVACFHQPVSFLVRRLSGEDVFDHGVASTTMLYGLSRRGFEPDLLEAFGVRERELPRIAEAHAAAGGLTAEAARLTGLKAGTPVAVGTGDDFSSPLGAGIVEPGTLACVAGTAEVVGALSEQPVVDPAGVVETHCFPGGLYFVENPGWLSGGALRWFVETFRLKDYRELDALAAATPPGAEGLCFLPALSGSTVPEWHAGARGCFYGLSAAHGTGHLARAVLEGCAFAMRDVVERLRALEVRTERIALMGGGSASGLWAQIRADLSGLEVECARLPDTAPRGAAMLAAVAAGQAASIRDCASRLRGGSGGPGVGGGSGRSCGPGVGGGSGGTGGAGNAGGRRFRPDPARREAYDRAYAAYHRLFGCLKPLFAEDGPDE